MDYQQTAARIVQAVGGAENIANLSHCATRLRIRLVEENLYDKDAVEAIPGVQGSVKVGSEYQIVIGNEVNRLYQALTEGFSLPETQQAASGHRFSLKTTLANVGTFMQGSIGFILVPLIGCGMIKALLTVLSTAGLMDSTESTYTFLYACADSVMYFIPVLLAVGAARRLGCSQPMAMIMALMTLNPTWTAAVSAGETVTLFGFTVPQFNFSTQFIPVLVSVWLYAKLEQFLKKYLPTLAYNILAPVISLLVMIPVIFFGIGQLFLWVNAWLEGPTLWLSQYRLIAIPLLAMLWPILTIFGLHGAVWQPLYLSAFTVFGFDPLCWVSYLATHMTIGAVSILSAVLTGDPERREVGLSTGLTMLLGNISEPAIFGVLLANRRLFAAQICAAGITGLYAALAGITNYVLWSPCSLLGLAGFIGPDSSLPAVLLLVVVAWVSAAFFIFLFDRQHISLKKKP